uniref:Ig-like domain-containing protein n=1 Tax=Hippocampus comes TaxID=109280 RepID=A0A3Q3E3Q2_HIPCM
MEQVFKEEISVPSPEPRERPLIVASLEDVKVEGVSIVEDRTERVFKEEISVPSPEPRERPLIVASLEDVKVEGVSIVEDRTEQVFKQEISVPSPGPKERPLIVANLEDVTVEEDTAVTLRASIKYVTQVKWFLNGQLLQSGNEFKCFTELDTHSLVIRKVPGHQGVYLCKASNSVGAATFSTELQVINKPKFVKTFEPVSAAIHEMLRLECQVNEDTGVTVIWTRDGKKVHQSLECKQSFDDKVAVLEIAKSKVKDSGTYVCTASNEAGSSSCEALVTVQEPPRFVKKMDPSVTWKQGIAARLHCTMKGSPELHIHWFWNERELSPGDKHKMSFTNGTATLEITNVLVTDSGRYTCEVSNNAGSESCNAAVAVKGLSETSPSSPFLLRLHLSGVQDDLQCRGGTLYLCSRLVLITEPPSIKKELQMVEAVKGASAVLECEVAGSAPFEITWSKNKRTIRGDHKYKVISQEPVLRLEIQSFESTDMGEYQCVVSNAVGKVTTKGLAKLKEPPTFAKRVESVTAVLGNALKLQGTVKGSAPIAVKWMKDSEILRNDDPNVTMSFENNVASLSIAVVSSSHAGKYLCHAENEAGQQKCEAALTVHGQMTSPAQSPLFFLSSQLEVLNVSHHVPILSQNPPEL